MTGQWMHRAGVLLALSALLAAGGCATTPDVAPFTEATIQLRGAVAASGAAVERELRTVPPPTGESDEIKQLASKQADDLNQAADKLKAAWPARIAAMDALVAYSESVQEIVKSGRQGAESAGALADALKTLAGSVGLAVPGSGAAAVGVDAAAFVYGHIAAVRASKSLEAALSNAQPAIDRIASILAADIRNLDEVLLNTEQLADNNLRTSNADRLRFRNELETAVTTFYKGSKAPLNTTDLSELKDLEEQLTLTQSWYGPLQADRDAVARRTADGSRLLDATSASVKEWADAHRQLLVAVREKRPVNAAALTQSIIEVRELIKRIREL